MLGVFLLALAVMVDMWVLRIIFIVLAILFIVPHTQKWTSRTVLGIFGFVLLLWLLLQTELVQNFLITKVTARLSKDLHTEVRIQHVSFAFFDKMDLDGALIRDQNKDTLLYAGSMKLRITDWFFLQTKTDLKYIGLENAMINIHRRDSVWNYQFLVDYFSKSSKTKKDTSASNIALNIQKVDLKKVTIVKNDEWIGQKMIGRVGSMVMDARQTDLDKSVFLIDSISVDRPYFSIENFDGLRPERVDTTTSQDTGMYFNQGNIVLKIGSVRITNGAFMNFKRGTVSDEGVFDGTNIRVSKIDGLLQKVSFVKDTIKAKIELTAVERSGFELKKLKAEFRFTPQIMEFANLDIRTPRSRLGNYYAMRYKDFNEDMSYYIEKVKMDAHFKNSVVSCDDIAFFAPELNTWNQRAEMSGKFHGTVENFKAENLFVRTSANSYAMGDLTMKGLPYINKTVITLTNANVQTNNKEIAFLYPDIRKITNPDLSALGNLRFIGNFSGTIQNFIAKGNITTLLGGLYTDINLKLPSKGEPSYKGNIQTQQFDLGKFLDVSSIGKINFTGKIEGTSFDVNKAKTSLNGNFNTFEFNDYTYKNLDFNGAIEKKRFIGDFKASDENFDFTSSIEIDLTGEQPRFNILGDLATANFQKLNFIKDDYRLAGLFDLNFTGRNIDAFLGSAKILNATLLHDSTRVDFDSLTVDAGYDSANRKVLSVESNQFAAKVVGHYNILDLPNSFQSFLSKYYPAYINVPKTSPKNQRFYVVLTTKNFNKYANLIHPKLSGLDSIRIVGAVNTDNSDSGFYMRAKIPHVKFDKYQLQDANIYGRGNYDSLHLTGNIGRAYVGDSLFFPNSTLIVLASNDHSVVHLSTSANETLNEADLNADVYTLEDGVRINFQPSSFILNTKKWELEKEGQIVIRKNFASANNVKFSQGFQEITVSSEDDEGGNTSNLIVRLKHLNIGDFVPLFTKRPRIEGLANGEIYLRDFYNKFNAKANLKAEQFRLDDDSIGVVTVNAGYDAESGKITSEVLSDNDAYNFSANGFYNLKDSVNMPMHYTAHLNNAKIGLVNEFLGNIFSNIDGVATGDLTIEGQPDSPNLLGQVALKNASLTVNYTQVRYSIDSAFFTFNKGSIDFGKFTLRDKYNNKASVRGILYENAFQNMRYDFDMSTDKLLLLDTKAKDNQQFYGKAIGKAIVSLKGPQENMQLNILGETNDTTHIYIPPSVTRENSEADFIVFKKYGKEITEEKSESDVKLNINLDLTANENAQIDVILDPLSGDVISATGNGRLKINVPANGDMTMNGRYNVESGLYNFNFQSVLRKPFELKKNAGSYIEWNGDPYKAQLHVAAQYTAKNVAVSDLIANTAFRNLEAAYGYRGDVYVIAYLDGMLSNPSIKFAFDFPEGSPIQNDPELKLFLNKIQSDDNEMLKQVTWLIVFDAFAPYGEFGGGGGTLARSTSINTISSKITGELNKVVGNWLTKITGDKSLRFDISTSTYSSSSLYQGTTTTSQSNQLDRQRIDFKVNQSLLNDKVIVTLGTGVDFNIGSSAAQTGSLQWLPDISVQFVLSKDRKLRAVVFNKSSLDASNPGYIGRTTRQGVGLSYTFDFPNDEKPPVVVDSASQAADIPKDSTKKNE